MLREDLIVHMLAAEQAAEIHAQRLTTQRALVPAIDHRHLRGFTQTLAETTSRWAKLRAFDFTGLLREATGMDAHKLKMVFSSMQRAGIIPAIPATEENMTVSEAERTQWFAGFKPITRGNGS